MAEVVAEAVAASLSLNIKFLLKSHEKIELLLSKLSRFAIFESLKVVKVFIPKVFFILILGGSRGYYRQSLP